MKKKKKLSLSVIKVKSFITKINEQQSIDLKGGSVFNCPKSKDGLCSDRPSNCASIDSLDTFCDPADQ